MSYPSVEERILDVLKEINDGITQLIEMQRERDAKEAKVRELLAQTPVPGFVPTHMPDEMRKEMEHHKLLYGDTQP